MVQVQVRVGLKLTRLKLTRKLTRFSDIFHLDTTPVPF